MFRPVQAPLPHCWSHAAGLTAPQDAAAVPQCPHPRAASGCDPALRRGWAQVPSQPLTVTSAKGLSQRLHCRPMTPGLQGHCPVSMSQARVWEPDGKQSQG